MRFEKIIASFLAVLVTALTAVTPALAATPLSQFPGFLGTDGTPDFYVVVGADAKPSDVVGAVDLMARLAELSYTTTTTAAAAEYDGIMRDGIRIGTIANGDALSTSAGTGTQFPTSGLVKNFHYSKLKTSTFSWKSTDYNYHEQFDVSNVRMRHDYSTSNINGTEKMQIQNDWVFYEYVFDKDLNMSAATTAGTTGTIASPEYTTPVKIKLLGKDFTIVGVGASSIKALSGSTGLADATTPVVYGDYSVYAIQGSNADWVKVQIKDASGNVVASDIVSISGGAKTFSGQGLDIRATSVRALQDGTIVGADLVVGPTGTTEKEYDNSADVDSTGTASDKFTGETRWGIQIGGSGWGVQKIPNGGKVQVTYKPTTSPEYYKAGEKLTLPNDYGYLAFEGWNTDQFVTVTISAVTSKSVYNNSVTTSSMGTFNGIEISADKENSIASQGGNYFTKAYVLFNRTNADGNIPVLFAFYDSSLSKIIGNGTVIAASGGGVDTYHEDIYKTAGIDYLSKYFDKAGSAARENITYSFKLNYGGGGEVDFYLNVTVNSTCIPSGMFASAIKHQCAAVTVGSVGGQQISMGWNNKTSVSTSAPEFRLGGTAASSEDSDVNATTEATSNKVGKSAQEVVDDSGILLQSPDSNAAGDKVVLKIPGKALAAKVYLGKKGATTGTGTVKAYAAMKSAVAKLDTEITSVEQAKNLVSVGGSAINKVSAKAMGLTYPTYGSSGLLPFSSGQGFIGVYDDVYTTGKKVVVVAGWEADQTRTSCTVAQQYDTLLSGQTASKVIITSATAAGITAVTTATTTTAAAVTTTTTTA